MVFFLIFMLQS